MGKDTIYRQAAIDVINEYDFEFPNYMGRFVTELRDAMKADLKHDIEALPSAQPFHNITMSDVLKYIDGMPEDVWQEFTACLECRGWDLQRRVAKWCGGEFA